MFQESLHYHSSQSKTLRLIRAPATRIGKILIEKKAPKLLTIRFSHFNEKARWFLDHHGIRYEEVGVFPLMHFVVRPLFGSMKGSQADNSSTRFSTPVLKYCRRECYSDSIDICNYALQMSNQKQRLAIDPTMPNYRKLFQHTRRFAYSQNLPIGSAMSEMAFRNFGVFQAALFRMSLPLVRRIIFGAFDVNQESVDRSENFIRSEFARLSDEVSKRENSFLHSDEFTYSDICLACASAPALLVKKEEGYGGHLPSLEKTSSRHHQLAHDLRKTPLGLYCMRLFAEHRGQRVIAFRKNLIASLIA